MLSMNQHGLKPFLVPMMVAGNELPEYRNTAGNITRRVPVFTFKNKVKKGDTKLGYKIEKELAWIIQACNKGYLDAIDIYGSQGIWDILPQYFKDGQDQMASDTNALTNFLKSDFVILGDPKKVYCLERVFKQSLMIMQKKIIFSNQMDKSILFRAISDFGIKISRNERRRYPNKPNEKTYTGTFIFGVDLKDIGLKK